MNSNLPVIPVKIARMFYAIAIIFWGVQEFMFGYLIGGRPRPWPEGWAGQNILAYITALVFIFAGVSVLINKKSTLALIAVAAYVLLWAGLQNLFQVVFHLDYGATLTSLGKSLTIGSGALLVAKSYNYDNDNAIENKIVSLGEWCQYLTGFFFLAAGIQHFIFADFVKFLVPSWIPGALFWTYIAGAALAATGIALITGIKAGLAAVVAGWMVLIWFFVLHIPLAIQNPDQNEWSSAFEALAVSGILFLIADNIRKKSA